MESYGLWRGSCVQTLMASKNLKKHDVNENMVIIYWVVPVSLGILIVGPISNQWMDFFRDSGVDWSCDRQLEDRTCAVSKLCPLVLKRGTARIPYSRRFLEVSLEKTYKSSGFSLAVFHYRKFHTVVTGQNRQVRQLSQIQLGKEKNI